MKNILLALALCCMLSAVASGSDTTFCRHQISVSMTNAMSQSFLDGPDHKPTAVAQIYYGYGFAPYFKYTYLPLYAAHVQLQYSLGITPRVRIETGIGYLLSSSLIKTYTLSGDLLRYEYTSTVKLFTGSISLPLHVKFITPTRHGAFTCTFGPEFTLPVHEFVYVTDIKSGGTTEPNYHERVRFTTSNTSHASAMGLYLKMGYEKTFNRNLSLNVGPALDFYQLVQFHPTEWFTPGSGYYPYQYYVGLDVAVSFGLKRK